MCFYNQKKRGGQGTDLHDVVVAETESWVAVYPTKISPLTAPDHEPLSHLQLMTKNHVASSLQLDEDLQAELNQFKKTICRFFRNTNGAEDPGYQTVFVETSFRQDLQRGSSHILIDAVGVPPSEEVQDFDIELFFQKALLEGDSEWEKSHCKKVIDTKARRGDLSKCLPIKGSFSFVHIDFDGIGGFAHIIEDEAKFGKMKALETLSAGPLGNIIKSIKHGLRSDKCYKNA